MNKHVNFEPAIDGAVLEVHSYGRARRADFHHSFYLSERARTAIDEGNAAFFWIDDEEITAHGTKRSGFFDDGYVYQYF